MTFHWHRAIKGKYLVSRMSFEGTKFRNKVTELEFSESNDL